MIDSIKFSILVAYRNETFFSLSHIPENIITLMQKFLQN